MSIYCPHCGRAIPSDSRVCAYCSKQIPSHGVIAAPEPQKKKETNIGLIIAIILVVIILGTIAIAATVYVYVSGMLGSVDGLVSAAIDVEANNGFIEVTLIDADESYYSYNNVDI